MGNEVYANTREISCKAANGKTTAAFPDVCLSPPSPPAGPVPIPYPNTAFASDTTKGSKTVQISGQEVMLKDSSTFKKSTGDEPATKSLGMGVVTHQITGEVSFASWSMDVKFEGENVDRHLDITVHNEQCMPANTPTWPYMDQMSIDLDHPCVNNMQKEHEACKDYTPHNPKGKDACPEKPRGGKPASNRAAMAHAKKIESNQCLQARRCMLQPYKDGACCEGQTPHHLVEASAFMKPGSRGEGNIMGERAKCAKYNADKAPCICVEGAGHGVGTHGIMHTFQTQAALKCSDGLTTVAAAQKSAAGSVTKTFPRSGCDEKCIESQLSAYHEQECKMSDPTKIRAIATFGEEKLPGKLALALKRLEQLAPRSSILVR
jgi:Domain of unknown function (DUF4150)/GHH signature containing HNH/Endo VII superfamily nuclease toxin  2